MTAYNLSALFLTLTVADFRKVKRTLRTLGSLGVTDYDSIVEQIVLGLDRKRQSYRDARDERMRHSWSQRG